MVVVYGNYAQSLGVVNTASDASGNVLEPQIDSTLFDETMGNKYHTNAGIPRLFIVLILYAMRRMDDPCQAA